MSATRKLRFYSLGNSDEASALTNLGQIPTSTFEVKDAHQLCHHLINLMLQGSALDKKLAILLTKEDLLKLQHHPLFKRLSDGTVILDEQEDLTILKQKLTTESNTRASTSSLWNQLYNWTDLYQYRNQVAQKKALGENPLCHLVAQYISNSSRLNFNALDKIIPNSDYTFETKEYWFLRGRINQGASIYQDKFDGLQGLKTLHPVFFEMYSRDEAYLVVYEVIRKIDAQINSFLKELEAWLSTYRAFAVEENDTFCTELRLRLLHLRQGAGEFESRDKQKPGSWIPWQSSSLIKDEEQSVISAYEQLLTWIDKSGHGEEVDLHPTQDLTSILTACDTTLSKFGRIKKRLKTKLDRHLLKLNRHTISDANLQLTFDHIYQNIRLLFEEVNGLQVFQDYWEDHTLNIQGELTSLQQLKNRISSVKQEVPHLKDYIEWKQFEETLSESGKMLISALKNTPPQAWVASFDQWYLKHYIDCQDLVDLGIGHESKEWLALFNKTRLAQLETTRNTLIGGIKNRLPAVLKSHKDLKKWWDKPEKHMPNTESVTAILSLFGVVLASENKVRDIERLAPELFVLGPGVSASVLMKTNTVPVHSIEYSTSAKSYVTALAPEDGLLYSNRTDRFVQIKHLAQFIQESGVTFTLFQNHREVYLIHSDHEMLSILEKGTAGSFQRHTINDKEGIDLLTESMVNNHNRTFHFYWNDEGETNRSPWFIFTMSPLLNALKSAGFDIGYLCWKRLMVFRDIIRLTSKTPPTANPPHATSSEMAQ